MKSNKKNGHRKIIISIIIVCVLAFGAYYFFSAKNKPNTPLEIAKVEKGEIVKSVSCDGVIEPVTNIEIKSNVGGTIVKLYAEEGDYVKAGQLLAQIDPVDVLTTLEKEQNNLITAKAKVTSSENSLSIQKQQAIADLESARESIRSATAKLGQAKKESNIQPNLTSNEIAIAKTNLLQAKASLEQLKKATSIQRKVTAKTNYDSAKANYDQANKTHERNKQLLEKGFLSKKDFETAEELYLSSKATLEDAKQKYDTIKEEVDQDIQIAEEKVNQAEISYQNAKTNSAQIDIKQYDVTAAIAALKIAKANYSSAEANLKQINVKESDLVQSKANLSSAKSSVQNAQTNYAYTNITAPRDGVIVKKWAEEGSIIMAGRASTAGSSSGVVIYEIADTTKMQVSVSVDETDIYNIFPNQDVKISVDAYPDKVFTGKVTKIAPRAETDSGVTTVPVEVTITQKNTDLKPVMNATCEFIIATKKDILIAPIDYINIMGDKASAIVMKDGKPQNVEVKIGMQGEEQLEILSGLKEGDEIISPRSIEMQNSKNKKSGKDVPSSSSSSKKSSGMGGMPPPP